MIIIHWILGISIIINLLSISTSAAYSQLQ
jgi:hypothetical protein